MKITVLTICNTAIDLKKHNGLFEYSQTISNEISSICVFNNDRELESEMNLPKDTIIYQCDLFGDMSKLAGQVAIKTGDDRIVLVTKNTFGNEFTGFLGTETNANIVLNASAVGLSDENIVVCKKVYSENLIGKFQCDDKLVASISIAKSDKEYSCVIAQVIDCNTSYDVIKDIEFEKAEENALEQCNVLIALGRGVKKSSLDKYQKLADILGGEIGGTRPVTYDGVVELSRMIGNSGKLVSPKLSIVFGASGALPFIAGIVGSEKIVSINKDENAMIFNNSHYGIVGDCDEYVEMLLNQLG